ncbi:unnamed protein product, partial [Phaeothamnion confervicola]
RRIPHTAVRASAPLARGKKHECWKRRSKPESTLSTMQTSGLKGAPHMLRARRRRHPTCCAVLVAATFATAARGFITSPLSSAFFASPQQSSAAAAGLQRSNAADGVLRQSPHRVYGVNEGRRMQTGRRRCVSNQQAADDVEAVVAAAAAVPELESHVESGLYASIKEQWRIHRKQKDLQEIIGRSVSVAEWAGAAGYRDSATMLAAINAGSRALNQLVRHHRPLVCAMARRYRRVTRFLTYDDLVQEGSVGLLSAVDHYDPTRGARFGTYAAWRVRGYMLRAIANKDTLIRLPVHVQDLGDRIRQAARRLGATGGPPPSDDELAGAVGVSLEAFRRHQALVESARAAAGGLDT